MTLQLSSTPLGHSTARVEVATRLRRLICSGALPGGSHLVQSEIADQFGVSVTPVREALRDLFSAGFIEFHAFQGAVVKPPSIDELRDLYELRVFLAPLVVRRSIGQIEPWRLDEAEEVAARMVDATPESWIDDNRWFHQLLGEPTEGTQLGGFEQRFATLAERYVGLTLLEADGRRADDERDHVDLVRAYRHLDTDRAIELTVDHLRAGLASAIDAHHRSEEATS